MVKRFERYPRYLIDIITVQFEQFIGWNVSSFVFLSFFLS